MEPNFSDQIPTVTDTTIYDVPTVRPQDVSRGSVDGNKWEDRVFNSQARQQYVASGSSSQPYNGSEAGQTNISGHFVVSPTETAAPPSKPIDPVWIVGGILLLSLAMLIR